MPDKYLHELKEFPELLRILEKELKINAQLIEKDYWIMHVLYGLKKQNFEFELKGGTSLSKGFGIIDRFSEDIDIHIKPPEALKVNINPNNKNKGAVNSRKEYYDWLANKMKIDGVVSIERDTQFDNTESYSSGGIRLYYKSLAEKIVGVKEGILLEAGFDTITPNIPITISSWAFEKAVNTKGIEIADNRALDIACYHPGYTLVEKLQTIATKFRRERESGNENQNLMRQYYDVYSLLNNKEVLSFIGTKEYIKHKNARFPNADLEIDINKNEAFLLNDTTLREKFRKRYVATANLYYKGQPPFDDLLARIKKFVDVL
jgi:predicted nucleotidyltransferase component of viral defense system